MSSRLAAENNLRIDSVDDAMDVLSSGIDCCIFTVDDVAAAFFDLTTGLAGDVFQKFVNYQCPVAFVLPEDHSFGARVTELAREHSSHPIVRFYSTLDAAMKGG